MTTPKFIASFACLAGLTVLCVSACQSGSRGVTSSPPAPSAPTAPSIPAKEVGTSDGAGGNGLNNKAFEAYRVDPLQLPAYRELSAIFANWNKQSGRQDFSYESLFKLRTWYVAPVKLKPIDDQTLGVSFAEGSVQQLAFQNLREVWIDAEKYNTLRDKPQEQAHLILHEFLFSLYSLKFTKLADYVNLLCENCDPLKGTVAAFDELYPPEAKRKLNDDDYKNIRNVTGWLMESGAKAKWQEITAKFIANKFPRPILGLGTPERKFIYKGFLHDLLKANNVTNNSFNRCFFLKNNISSACHVTLGDLSQIQDGEHDFVLKVDLPHQHFDYKIQDNDIEWHPYLKISSYLTPDLQNLYTVDTELFDKPSSVGKTAQRADYFFIPDDSPTSEDPSSLNCNALVLTSYVAATASDVLIPYVSDGPAGKTSGERPGKTFNYKPVNPHGLADDVLILTSDPAMEETLRKMYRLFPQQGFWFTP
jgi:hypothetical protein